MSRLATRLTLAVVGITAGTVLVAGLAMWWSTALALQASIDRELDGRAERTRRFDGMMSGRWRGPRSADARGPRLMHIVAADGSTIFGGDPEQLLLPDDGVVPDDGWRGTVRGMRVLAVAVKGPPGPAGKPQTGVIALLGEDLAGVRAELRRMAIGLSVLWLVATALAIGAALLLRRAVLRPLADLDQALARLRPDDLTARVPEGAGPDEARSLVLRLNTLLSGLDEAFRREQATIANIAHELRTPVAGLRTTIEFRLLASIDPGERELLCGLLATVGRMQSMVGNILMLARLEAGRERLDVEDGDAVRVLNAVIERWEPRALARGLAIDANLPGSFPMRLSPAHAEVVFDNLLGNAVAHGQPGPAIGITLVDGVLTITNACTSRIDVARLGTAFYRADDARSDGAHCGLGLALCRRIAAVLAMQLDLQVDGGVFTAHLRMTSA